MSRRYVLAPEAALDLVGVAIATGQLWKAFHNGPSAIATRSSNLALHQEEHQSSDGRPVESVIRDKIVYLAERPGRGHWRKDLRE
jgi:hypothetical protein